MDFFSIVKFIYLIITCFYILLALGFLITFFHEKNYRALLRGILIFLPPAILLLSIFYMNIQTQIQVKIFVVIDMLAILFFLIMMIRLPANSLQIDETRQKRIDERDAFFHRFYFLKPGMPEFTKYYQANPKKKEIDDAIRKLPELGESGSRGYHAINSLYQLATFDIISRINRPAFFPADKKSEIPPSVSTAEITDRIKGYAHYLGADLVGIAKLNPAHIYSHNARGEGKWGASIELNHQFAIVVATEMKSEMIRQAPEVAVTTESSFQYMETAKIALILARFVSFLGFDARAHIDGNYRVLCIPVAVDAGLGELGRHGLLITPEFGSRVRLAAVTTNLPLIADKPLTFGVQHFCEICKKCAKNCPSASVDKNEKKWINGVKKWKSEQESCYRFWRLQGSDCSVCINECPYSYPNTPMHNLIRFFVKKNNFSRTLIYWGDRLFYGKRQKGHLPIPEWHRQSTKKKDELL